MSQIMTRRRVTSGLAALLVTPAIARAAADNPQLEAAARDEGSLTWYIAQVDAETAENFGRSFSQSNPGVAVGVIRTTGQVAYQRLLMDIKNHTPQCDVFSTTDISHMPILKERHELRRIHRRPTPMRCCRRSRRCRTPGIPTLPTPLATSLSIIRIR